MHYLRMLFSQHINKIRHEASKVYISRTRVNPLSRHATRRKQFQDLAGKVLTIMTRSRHLSGLHSKNLLQHAESPIALAIFGMVSSQRRKLKPCPDWPRLAPFTWDFSLEHQNTLQSKLFLFSVLQLWLLAILNSIKHYQRETHIYT